ncbi:hypothetical protein JB92DRAFT_3010983 [Gautieria morchelliformis]|nr:hypothetical protein JB92DRAFT_3010983 [Gautieria morchelliformis]
MHHGREVGSREVGCGTWEVVGGGRWARAFPPFPPLRTGRTSGLRAQAKAGMGHLGWMGWEVAIEAGGGRIPSLPDPSLRRDHRGWMD